MYYLFVHFLELSGGDVGDVVWCRLWDVEVEHEGTGCRRVCQVDAGEVHVDDKVWRVVG